MAGPEGTGRRGGDRVPGDAGPRRIHQDEIRTAFADGFSVDAITTSSIEATFLDEPAPAWLATITRQARRRLPASRQPYSRPRARVRGREDDRVDESTTTVTTADGQQLHVHRWAPDGAPRAVVQVQHGLAEHAARYRRFAGALTAAGYLVYAADARGSGRSAVHGYGVWGADGWPGWVDDVGRLSTRIREDQPDLPLAIVGHSMGSFATQQHLLDHADEVDAVVLSGSTEVSWLVPVLDADEPADLSTFNEPFEHRTGFEWLSRDEAEVDLYVADPACGWEAPPLGGIATLASAADPDRVAEIRDDLPILIVSGRDDPLAQGGATVEALAEQYRAAGLTDVQVRLYDGARHEVLNETNRDEVTADILAFLDRALPA